MSEHFLSKIRVAPEDFVEADGRPVLERYDELRALLAERAGPEVAALFAEPLVSRGNDAAPPTVSWYAPRGGEARPLAGLPPAERTRAEAWLSDHLRPLRALAEDPATSGLALGALSVFGQDDVVVVGDRPMIVNWGLMPGGQGANAGTRKAHYAATLGRFLPLEPPAAAPAGPQAPAAAAGMVAAPLAASQATEIAAETPQPGQRITPLAWVPLLILLLLAGLALIWILLPGNRLFQTAAAPAAITDDAALAAARELNAALRQREAALQAALTGAVCRDDGVLVLPDGRTPEGLTPPPLGVAPEQKAQGATDAMLPNRAGRVLVPDGGTGEDATLLALIEARTVLVVAAGEGGVTTGSGLVIGPGLIVTNQHVVAPLPDDGQIWLTGATMERPHPATVLKTNGPLAQTGGDFALLSVEGADLAAFTVYQAPQSLKLTNVIAAGYPGDVLEIDAAFAALASGESGAVPELTLTDGIVNTEQQLGPDTHVLMHSAALSAGNSGGPLVDMCGRLVGVNTFVRQGRMQNRGFALTTGDLLAFLNGTEARPDVVSTPCEPVVLTPQLARDGAAPAPGAGPE